MAGTFVAIFLVSAIISGLIGLAIGVGKGRGAGGFWLGFFLGIIGWIIVALLQPTAQAEAQRLGMVRAAVGALPNPEGAAAAGGNRTCPYCAESIKAAAVVCRYCGRDVEPVVVPEAAVNLDPAQRAREGYTPQELDRRRQAFAFLKAEHPTSFDAVWDAAVVLRPWPLAMSTPPLRAACVAVKKGVPADEAVRAAFANAK
jgi:hypothetical protein